MTTGERLVDISTLSTGTALDHFLNISGGGSETVIRVFGEYAIRYIHTEQGVIRYVRPDVVNVQYVAKQIMNITYVPTEQGVIRYVRKPTIKVEYDDTSN
jgi:hypothetical protein